MPAPAEAPAPIRFQRNAAFLSGAGSAGIIFSAARDSDVLAALLSETRPFPPRTIDLGEISVEAETGRPIEFGRGADAVSFRAKGGAYAGIGVYLKGSEALSRLTPDESLLPGFELADAADSSYVMLRWGYGAEANAQGAMALGPAGRATLAAEGSLEGLFAVLRQTPRSMPARKALQAAVDNWVIPRKVESASQIEPGTWLVAEVTGSVKATVGARVGYDFNWIREAELGNLKGDVGLRIQLAAGAAVSFGASGRCCVVVSRESALPVLRLRVYRLASRNLNLAFDAGAVFQPVSPSLPPQADDFIKAVFGTHGAQVLKHIAVVEKWTDPAQSLDQLLASAGVEEAKQLVAHMAGVKVEDLQKSFDRVHATAVRFIGQWNQLPHTLSSTVLKLVEEQTDLGPVRELVRGIANADAAGLRTLLNEQLRNVAFFTTPAGMMLESMAGESVLALLARPIGEVRQTAQLALSILDGSQMEAVLVRFQEYVEERLNVGKLLDTVTAADFAALDALLKKRVGELLGKTIDFSDLETIRSTIQMLLKKRQQFYEQAVQALNRKYQLLCTGAFQKTSTDEALLDIRFDFRGDPAGVGEFLKLALAGDFDRILTEPRGGVELNSARMTHGIQRQAQIDVTLPYFDSTQKHLNQALATVEAREQDGRVLVYEASGKDTVANNRRTSTLALAMSLPVPSRSAQFAVHRPSLQLSYSLRQAMRGMTQADLLQLGPMLAELLPTQLPAAALPAFARYIDQRTEQAIPGTPSLMGNALLSVEVAVSEEVAAKIGAAWLTLPAGKDAEAYKRISFALQKALKTFIPRMYFSAVERYHDVVPAHLLLAYSAIPNFTDSPDHHWDWPAVAKRRAALKQGEQKFALLLEEARKRVAAAPDLGGVVQFYNPDDAASILKSLGGQDSQGSLVRALLTGLLGAEAEIVKTAIEAGRKIASFAAAADKPSKAIAALADFAAKLTEAFNEKVRSLYLGPAIQPLGTRLLLEASRAIVRAPNGEFSRHNAIFNLYFLEKDAPFDPRAFLESGQTSGFRVAVRERVVELM